MTRFCNREKEREKGREKQRGRERETEEIIFSFQIIYKQSGRLKLAFFKILKQIKIII